MSLWQNDHNAENLSLVQVSEGLRVILDSVELLLLQRVLQMQMCLLLVLL